MKKITILLAVIGLALSPAAAFADPDFGPGNSVKGPNDSGAKCHDPAHGTDLGSNDAEPGCKG